MAKHEPGSGSIFGIVTEDGLVKDSSPVYLMDMQRGEGVGQARMLRKTLTAADGTFAFNGLNAEYDGYALVASDEDDTAGEYKNALIQDRVQPIRGHTEATWAFNWLADTLDRGPVAGILPAVEPITYSTTGGNIPFGLFSSITAIKSSSADPFTFVSGNPVISGLSTPNPTAIPAGPDLTRIRVNDVICAATGEVKPFKQLIADTEATLEFVIDLDSVDGLKQSPSIALCTWFAQATNTTTTRTSALSRRVSNSNSNASMGLMWCVYDSAARTLNWYAVKSTITSASFKEILYNMNHTSGVYADLVASVDVSAYVGVVHVALVYKYGTRGGMFINGSLVHEVATCPNVYDYHNQTDEYAASGGQQYKETFFTLVSGAATSVSQNTTQNFMDQLASVDCSVGLVVGYDYGFSDAQVADRYSKLFDLTVLPQRTGYEKAVLTQQPYMYCRLNDPVVDGASPASVLIPPRISGKGLYLEGASSVVALQTSPVTGGNAISLTGLLETNSDGPYFSPSLTYISGTCWVKFNDAVPAADEVIFQQFKTEGTEAEAFDDLVCGLRRTVGNTLALDVTISGTARVYDFNTYNPPANTWLFVAFAVDCFDTSNPEVSLYVGDESTQVSLQQTVIGHSGTLLGDSNTSANLSYFLTDESADAFVHQDRNNMPTAGFRIGGGFSGNICELALFPRKLSPSALIDIWTAKDSV